MSVNFFLIILLSVAYAKAQENEICECHTEKEQKANEELWNLLKKLEKLSSEVPEEQKIDYAASPGNLYQLGCNCDEKMRRKRKVEDEHEDPVEVVDTAEKQKEIRQKRHLIHHKFRPYPIDLRCPKGTYWIARTCVPKENLNEAESAEIDEEQ